MATDFKGLNGNTQPPMPFWWFIVQIVTCVLGLAIFIVACYCIHVLPGGGPQAFLLFDVSRLPSYLLSLSLERHPSNASTLRPS